MGQKNLHSYDFYAAGKDCCTGLEGNFDCGQIASKYNTHAGKRWVSSYDTEKFEIALEQFQAQFATSSDYPLFFYWESDPVADMNSLVTYRTWTIVGCGIGYLILQIILIYVGVNYLNKRH